MPFENHDPAFRPLSKPKLGMFGRRGFTAAQQVAMGGDGSDMALAKPAGPDWRRIAGIVGDTLAGVNGQPGMYAKSQNEIGQQSTMLQRQMELARWKAQNPDPTGTMQNVAAAGLKPGTPEYQAFMQKILQQPRYMVLGNPESGQTVIDANNPPQDSGPPPEAVAHLKSDPSLAAQFDEVFGPGAAARAMGAQ